MARQYPQLRSRARVRMRWTSPSLRSHLVVLFGQAGRAPRPREGAASDAPEHRLALLHERTAAFLIVLTREAVGDHLLADVQVRLMAAQQLAHRPLQRLQRKRRVRGDGRELARDE